MKSRGSRPWLRKDQNMSSRIRRFGRFLWRCLVAFWVLLLFSPLILKIIGDMIGNE
jgi:hypothetical protein